MLATIGAAALTIVGSLALGAGMLRTLAPQMAPATAGGVGYGALICVAVVLVRAPGRATTALIVIVALIVIAALSLTGAHRARGLHAPATTIAAAVLSAAAVLALLLLPFFAAGHFGPLGVGLDNDLGFHLGWVYDLAHGPPPFQFFSFGYPLGGESLAACLSRLGIGDEQALIGVAAAAVVLTAIAALAALREYDWKLRLPLAIACGLPYLSAGYFGEGSFKEPTMGLLVVTLALALTRPARDASGWSWSWGYAVVVLVLSAASVFIFGPPGLIWPVVFILARAFAERWQRPRARAAVARHAIVAVVALGAIALIAVIANALGNHIGAGGFRIYLGGPPAREFGGNFPRQLPLSEGLGVWFGRDFRYGYSSGVFATAAVVLAIALFAGSAASQAREWRTTLLLPAAAAIVIYLATRATTLAYFSAKLIVSAGPLLVLFLMAGLLRMRRKRAVPVLLALAFAAAVIWSSADALRSSPVDDPTLGAELASFRPLITAHSVVFLGDDGWSPEWLRGAMLTAYGVGRRLSVRPFKSEQPPFDFDTPDPALLNSADYVITTRTLDASSPPPNWALVRTTAHYELFARRGTASDRAILDEQGAPGATLDCSRKPARELAGSPGIAAVRAAPVASSRWRDSAGNALPPAPTIAYMSPGEVGYSTVRAASGPVELSLAYSTALPITLLADTKPIRLTPTLEPYGPLWRAAVISTHTGPISLQIQIGRGRVSIGNRGALVGLVYAEPTDRGDTIVRLRAACGRYVDWYHPFR